MDYNVEVLNMTFTLTDITSDELFDLITAARDVTNTTVRVASKQNGSFEVEVDEVPDADAVRHLLNKADRIKERRNY
ncbi:hypothetical protein [Streptomyces sp. NPDC048350]|uniref:hypothetical protein n=1 Tax=Streptomyces sp. NPDC048350 TaxID=3365538 RepID=UPI003712AD75